MLLQVSEIFLDIAQLGIVFALLVAIVFVLGRRIVKLENENKELVVERLESTKEIIIILKDATDSMNRVSKHIENGNL